METKDRTNGTSKNLSKLKYREEKEKESPATCRIVSSSLSICVTSTPKRGECIWRNDGPSYFPSSWKISTHRPKKLNEHLAGRKPD